MKFVFHVFSQLNMTPAPSLSKVKNTVLPGFCEPQKVNLIFLLTWCDYIVVYIQHYTAQGVPFYVNKPSNIVRRCLAMPDISSAIARFPVVPKNEMRYIGA